MNVYIWELVKQTTHAYHSEGGVVVIAESEQEARRLANEISGCRIEPEEGVTACYPLTEVEGISPRVFIFPDAGCC